MGIDVCLCCARIGKFEESENMIKLVIDENKYEFKNVHTRNYVYSYCNVILRYIGSKSTKIEFDAYDMSKITTRIKRAFPQ